MLRSHALRGCSLVLLTLGLAAAPHLALAGSVTVQVVDQAGAPVEDAVVWLMPAETHVFEHGAKKGVIDQVHRRFTPLVSVFQTGTLVSFPNKDNIEHDVYSFSPAKTFELNLYSGVPSQPVKFDKPGLVVLGCNIHDQMVAYVEVVDTPYFGKTDASGRAKVEDVPSAGYEALTWHFRQGQKAEPVRTKVRVDTAETTVRVSLDLPAS